MVVSHRVMHCIALRVRRAGGGDLWSEAEPNGTPRAAWRLPAAKVGVATARSPSRPLFPLFALPSSSSCLSFRCESYLVTQRVNQTVKTAFRGFVTRLLFPIIKRPRIDVDSIQQKLPAELIFVQCFRGSSVIHCFLFPLVIE